MAGTVTHGSRIPYHTQPPGWETWCGMPLGPFNQAVAYEGAAWSANSTDVTCDRCLKVLLPRSLEPAVIEDWLDA